MMNMRKSLRITLLNTSKNSINGITIFFITTTVILASVVLLGIGFIIGSNSVNLESKAYKNGVVRLEYSLLPQNTQDEDNDE